LVLPKKSLPSAPMNVHIMLCLQRVMSNLKITAVMCGTISGVEESVPVVVSVRGGSTLTANASRKRKQADRITAYPSREQALNLAALTATDDALFGGDTSLAALPPRPCHSFLSTIGCWRCRYSCTSVSKILKINSFGVLRNNPGPLLRNKKPSDTPQTKIH